MLNYPLTPREQLLMLWDYVPYGVQMQWRNREELATLTGIDFGLGYVQFVSPGDSRTQHVVPRDSQGIALTPLLYDLADVPKLPAREDEDGDVCRPVVTLVDKLNILKPEEVIEEVVPLTSVSDGFRPRFLSLLVHTWLPEWQQRGDDYEVFVGAFGEIQWRNVTADGISVAEHAAKGTGNFRHLWGTFLLAAYAYLRELHVAVGPIAQSYRALRYHGDSYHDYYHYWKLAVPAQEGGQDNG